MNLQLDKKICCIAFNTKSDGQALRVSLVKLVAYLSSNYFHFHNFDTPLLIVLYFIRDLSYLSSSIRLDNQKVLPLIIQLNLQIFD